MMEKSFIITTLSGMDSTGLWTTTGAAGILFLSVLNVVPYRLVRELNAAANCLGIDFSCFDFSQDGFCTFQEGLFDIFSSLGACFEENQVVLLSEGAGLEECHFSCLLEIFFVPNKDDDDVRTCKGSCVI